MSETATLPIACHLSESKLARRQAQITEEIFRECQEVNELADGYEFRFAGGDEWFGRLTEFVAVERKCCPFFTFYLIFAPQQSAIWLRLQGAAGVKEFIQNVLTPLAGQTNVC